MLVDGQRLRQPKVCLWTAAGQRHTVGCGTSSSSVLADITGAAAEVAKTQAAECPCLSMRSPLTSFTMPVSNTICIWSWYCPPLSMRLPGFRSRWMIGFGFLHAQSKHPGWEACRPRAVTRSEEQMRPGDDTGEVAGSPMRSPVMQVCQAARCVQRNLDSSSNGKNLRSPEGVCQRPAAHELCDKNVGLLLRAGAQEL